MASRDIMTIIERMENAIINSEYYKQYPDVMSKDIFKRKKYENSSRLINIQINFLEDSIWGMLNLGEDSKALRPTILSMIDDIRSLRASYADDDFKNMLRLLQHLKKDIPKTKEDRQFEMPRSLPYEIKEEVVADMEEMMKCYKSGCLRSAVVLCGRVLETCLHRKYFEATGIDILEKSPGIGLGKLIAKMMEKKVDLDPGLTQQIHLVNQVRVFSVHKKQSVFYPSKAQAHAMILYTLDTIERLF